MNMKRNSNYDRVMPRVYDGSRLSLISSSNVTRHEIPSSARVGAKQSVSKVSSGVFSELPTVLNDYVPDSSREDVKRSNVVKPKRTLKSLDPAKSPPRVLIKAKELRQKSLITRSQGSVPSIVNRVGDKWSDSHVRQCYSSRSHTRLKELKDEIKAYQETEKLIKIRSKLYKSCGVVLDDVGQVAVDKAVQAEPDREPEGIRSELDNREDAGAAVPDQQMRAATSRFPVDRYLVESSNKFELVNIIEDEIWNPEPALRPEDELVLRKLYDMLQSTADDLKLLSGELSKFREPGVQVKMQPTPLDEEFNEKVHIEEVVNAKFHGYKIVNKSSTPASTFKMKDVDRLESLAHNLQKSKVSTGVQVSTAPTVKKPVINRSLSITKTKIIQIDEQHDDNTKNNKLKTTKVTQNTPAVAYNEYSFKYVEPTVKVYPQKNLLIQDMPSINIRSELKEQKVLQLDIIPEAKGVTETTVTKPNVVVIAVDHDTESAPKHAPKNAQTNFEQLHSSRPLYDNRQPVRKVSKMSTCDSSGSTNNVSSDTRQKMKTQKHIQTVLRTSPKSSARIDRKKNSVSRKESEKRSHSSLGEWKRKLNSVYGQTSASKLAKIASKSNKNSAPKISNLPSLSKTQSKALNNAEYIPYSQLTLGGVRVSDVEKEISNVPNKSDIPLSPLLDKILSSRENSFRNDSPRKSKKKASSKVFTTSDENLLQEVIDIERTVSKTISKNLKKKANETLQKTQKVASESSENKENSYVDDFEDERSEITENSKKLPNYSDFSPEQKDSSDPSSSKNDDKDNSDHDDNSKDISQSNIQNTTYTKAVNLSFKDSVDVYEFVHSVDTQDTATQSNTVHKISLKETQTSPRNEKTNIQPIHNELWPFDPKGEVEKIFKLEKDFIKKMILDEYGDLLEKNITKPSTSKDNQNVKENKNVASFQKNTQTSPAHVKCVMTSPTRTKTRTTSPFLSLTVDHHTSPMIVVTNEDEFKVEVDDGEEGISINLSSPRFSLRLPQTSREVLSNLEACSNTPNKIENDNKHVQDNNNKTDKIKSKTFRKSRVSSSSSVDGDKSSSEMTSLGEVKSKLRRRMRKSRIPTVSESSSSSVVSKYSSDAHSGGILPLRSEGEVSVGQIRKAVNKFSKSEGETSLGQLSK